MIFQCHISFNPYNNLRTSYHYYSLSTDEESETKELSNLIEITQLETLGVIIQDQISGMVPLMWAKKVSIYTLLILEIFN